LTSTIVPVADGGASTASQRITSATSSVVPTRPSGMSAMIFAPPRPCRYSSVISDTVKPGATPKERIPSAAEPRAIVRVIPTIAALDAA
jgi:hypothetical protein